VRVSVLEFATVNGERQLQPVAGAGFFGPLGLETDDRGVYRLYGLPAGEYVVSASLSPVQFFGTSQPADLRRVTAAELQWAATQLSGSGTGAPVAAAGASVQTSAPPPGQSVGLATVYYPGTTDPAAAALIRLAAGEERDGVDFGVELVPTARVSGRVTGPDGQPVTGVQVLLAPASVGGPGIAYTGLTRTDTQGAFTSNALPPGQYDVIARIPTPPAVPTLVNGAPVPAQNRPANPLAGYWASTSVGVNGQDIDALALTLQPGLTLSGRVMFDASAGDVPPEASRVRLLLLPVQGGPLIGAPSSGQVNEDGTFELIGITPGQYRLSVGVQGAPGDSAASWGIRSATVSGRDLADRLVAITPDIALADAVVTLTDRTAEVDGRLLDAVGRPTTEYSAMLFSTNPDHWFVGGRRLKVPVRPSTDGRFRFTGLPPGEYFMAAVTDVNPRDLGDRAFLEQIASNAIRITVVEGEKKTQDLRLAGQ
jgi:hypothetical protein